MAVKALEGGEMLCASVMVTGAFYLTSSIAQQSVDELNKDTRKVKRVKVTAYRSLLTIVSPIKKQGANYDVRSSQAAAQV